MRDGSTFTKHAAPQAIDARLRTARYKRDALEKEIVWLTRLAEQRQDQIDQGTWPRKENR